uniref:Uncharacterized protein n=1 Tax=Eutreptiella gymnastica TaxID=73025 RepID=A0A7S4G9L3_9EUGL
MHVVHILCQGSSVAKRTAACDKVEISGNFDRWMPQQYCEWIGDKVDERKLSGKSPIPCPDHQEFANMVAAVCAQISSQNQPQNLAPRTPAKGDAQGKKKKQVQ